MTSELAHVRNAFVAAAQHLGFKFNLPPLPGLEDAGLYLVGHVVDFGGPKGCIPILLDTPRCIIDAVERDGYYRSQLSSSYAQFNEQLFLDTLNDWGFHGPVERRPIWYSGSAWVREPR